MSRAQQLQYPIAKEILASVSGVTRQIICWLLSEDVQRAISDGCSCKLTINVKGGDIVTVIEKHRRLDGRSLG